LKLLFTNCGQTAADEDTVTDDSLWEVGSALTYYRRLSTTYRLAISLHDWHSAL